MSLIVSLNPYVVPVSLVVPRAVPVADGQPALPRPGANPPPLPPVMSNCVTQPAVSSTLMDTTQRA